MTMTPTDTEWFAYVDLLDPTLHDDEDQDGDPS